MDMDIKKSFFILMFAVILITQVSLVSSAEWDNVGHYNETTRTYTIENWFGIGKTIAKLQLLTPINTSIPKGENQMVALFKIENFEDYNKPFKKMDFYNLKRKWKKDKRDFEYKYLTYINETKQYENCDDYLTRTNCVSFNQTNQIENWTTIGKKDVLFEGNYTIGIFAEYVLRGDLIEWIPEIYGIELTEWATWNDADAVTEAHGVTLGSSSTATAWRGMNITMGDEDVVLVNLTKHASSVTNGTCAVFNGTNQVQIAFGSFLGDVCTFSTAPTVNVTLEANQKYAVVVYSSGTVRYAGATFPIGNTYINWTKGIFNGLGSQNDEVNEIISIGVAPINTNENPQITLVNPSDNYYTTATNFTFNATVTDDVQVAEVNFFIDSAVNETNTSLVNGTYVWERTLAEGNHTWSVGAEDNEGATTNSSTRTIIIDNTVPTIALGNLSNITGIPLPSNSTLQLNATDSNLDDCYYNHTGNATYTVTTCGNYFNITWATAGSKTVQYCANDTVGNQNCSTSSLIVYNLETATSDAPDPVGEGVSVQYDFQINETANGIPTTTANLIHNGTTYSVSSIFNNGTQYKFQKNITMQDGWGSTTGQNVSFYWEYNVTGLATGSQTSTENTTVYSVAFDNCSAYTDHILDWTLEDEETTTEVNGSAGANVEIDLQVSSEANTSLLWTHNETWTNQSSGSVCVPSGLLSGNINYKVDFTMGFSSTDHVWEFYYLDNGNLNATKNFNNHTSGNVTLYDLLTTDSTSFLFNYFNEDGLSEPGSLVHVFRKYIGDGQFFEVERGKADENGDTVIHLVEEDVIYYFMITLESEILYTSQTYTALCQATPCEIQLEASGDFIEFDSDYDLLGNGAYSVTSDDATRTVNLTYDLTSSSTMNLTIYKFDGNGSYTPIVSDAETGTSGTIIVTVPQSAGNVTFFASVYQDDQFINSEWVTFENDLGFYIGSGLALFLAFLIVLTLGLVAVTEGVGTVVMVVLGLAVTGFLGLVRLRGATGYGLMIYIICAGAILIYKLARRERGD